MQKLFKAVPLSGVSKTVFVTAIAETDFNALDRAKQSLGADVAFELWDGDRLALIYKPVAQTASTIRSENDPAS